MAGAGHVTSPPGRKPAARNRKIYRQTVPAPSAKRQRRGHGRTSTHAGNSTDDQTDRPSAPTAPEGTRNRPEAPTAALSHVSMSYDGHREVLHDIDFTLDRGEFLSIVGPSGCGKSTLLNIVAGLLTPSTGTVQVDGEPLTGINRRATYMFQQDALLPWKTVRENVAIGLRLGGVPKADAHARANGWLARVGLTPFAAHYPSQLSGGMRKRVVMAQNWIIDRGIVLMDEPFSALDVHTRQQMETELLTLWEGSGLSRTLPEKRRASPPLPEPPTPAATQPAWPTPASTRPESPAPTSVVSGFSQTVRKTIVFVTHDLEEAIALADEVVILSAGPAARIVARHPVPLERPRDLMELRTAPAFVDLYRAIWVVLREEVIKSQRGTAHDPA